MKLTIPFSPEKTSTSSKRILWSHTPSFKVYPHPNGFTTNSTHITITFTETTFEVRCGTGWNASWELHMQTASFRSRMTYKPFAYDINSELHLMRMISCFPIVLDSFRNIEIAWRIWRSEFFVAPKSLIDPAAQVVMRRRSDWTSTTASI